MTRATGPRDALPIPGAPGYYVTPTGVVWHDNGRPAPWTAWTRLRRFPVGGRPGYVRLTIGGRAVIRSVDVLRAAAFDPDPASWLTRIVLGPERRPPGLVRPPALPPIAPSYVAPRPSPAATLPPIPGPVGPLEAEPLVVRGDVDQARGERNGRARLSADQVVEARRLRREGWTLRELALRYGVGEVTIGYAVTGRTWSHLPLE